MNMSINQLTVADRETAEKFYGNPIPEDYVLVVEALLFWGSVEFRSVCVPIDFYIEYGDRECFWKEAKEKHYGTLSFLSWSLDRYTNNHWTDLFNIVDIEFDEDFFGYIIKENI